MSGYEEFEKNTDELTTFLGQRASDANDKQCGGDHYLNKAIQPWDFIAANGLDFFQGNIVKYVVRFREKHGVADLEKARHYLDKLIELERAREQK